MYDKKKEEETFNDSFSMLARKAFTEKIQMINFYHRMSLMKQA